MTRLDSDFAYWALVNDLFYSKTDRIVAQLDEGATIRDVYEQMKGRKASARHSTEEYSRRLERTVAEGVELLTITGHEYPRRLRDTPNPPLLLYRKGTANDYGMAVAIAGRRNLSLKGHSDARELGRRLASQGILVVNGLARGADTEAHCGALEAGGQTVAVLAGWLDDIYPKENTSLALDISRNGALLTMTSPLTNVQRHYFIRRNRITSGISRCLVIIESNGRGGTPRQVDWALEQKRPVLVLKPDPKNGEAASAYRRFVADGAHGFADLDSLVDYIGGLDFNKKSPKSSGGRRITEYS